MQGWEDGSLQGGGGAVLSFPEPLGGGVRGGGQTLLQRSREVTEDLTRL